MRKREIRLDSSRRRPMLVNGSVKEIEVASKSFLEGREGTELSPYTREVSSDHR